MRADFIKTDSHQGVARIYANGVKIGEGEIPRTAGRLGMLEPLDIGRDRQTPVSESYECPFAFSGTLHRVEVFLGGREVVDVSAELDALLATQ